MINGFATTEELANKAAAMGKFSLSFILHTSGSSRTLSRVPRKRCGSVQVLVHREHNVYRATFDILQQLQESDVDEHWRGCALPLTPLSPTVSKGLVPKPLHVPFRTEEDLLARAIAQGPKTVDVPASLPTPPHNNQEELR